MAHLTFHYNDEQLVHRLQSAFPELNFGGAFAKEVELENGNDGGVFSVTLKYALDADQFARVLGNPDN